MNRIEEKEMKKAKRTNGKVLIAFCLASKNFGLVIIFSQMKHTHIHLYGEKTWQQQQQQ